MALSASLYSSELDHYSKSHKKNNRSRDEKQEKNSRLQLDRL